MFLKQVSTLKCDGQTDRQKDDVETIPLYQPVYASDTKFITKSLAQVSRDGQTDRWTGVIYIPCDEGRKPKKPTYETRAHRCWNVDVLCSMLERKKM